MFSNLIVFISCTEIALFCSEINKKLRGLISFYCYTILHKLFSLISNPVYRILQLKILYCIGKTFLKYTNPLCRSSNVILHLLLEFDTLMIQI